MRCMYVVISKYSIMCNPTLEPVHSFSKMTYVHHVRGGRDAKIEAVHITT